MHLWRVGDRDELNAIPQARLDLESRLETWLTQDISILDSGLLVLDRQVETEFGGIIDILCLNAVGDLVIVELKRDKTPREITAQALDYASWVAGLSNERVSEIAERRFGDGGLEDAFRERFGTELPDALNADHHVVIVGSLIDESSERIIRYLSETYGVKINAATFQYFREPDGTELLARIFLIEPSQVELHASARGPSRRTPRLSYEQLSDVAAEAGIGGLYEYVVSVLEALLKKSLARSSIGFGASLDGSWKTVISLFPTRSSAEDGLAFRLYTNRYRELTNLSADEVAAVLPGKHERHRPNAEPELEGYHGFIARRDEIDRIARPLPGASIS